MAEPVLRAAVASRLLNCPRRMSKAKNSDGAKAHTGPLPQPGGIEFYTATVGPLGVASENRNRNRERLYNRLRAHPVSGLPAREIDNHFESMPARYWERVTKTELIWGLEAVHAFCEKAASAVAGQGLAVADSRHYPERGFSKVMICSW